MRVGAWEKLRTDVPALRNEDAREEHQEQNGGPDPSIGHVWC